MDELFVLVYFLIALNMFIIMFMGYKECNNQKIGFEVVQQETLGLSSSGIVIQSFSPLRGSEPTAMGLVENQDRRGMESDNIFTRKT